MKSAPFFFILYLASATLYSQSAIDSLKAQMKDVRSLKEKAQLVSAIAEAFFTSSRYDSIGKYADELFDIGNKLRDKETVLLGRVYKAQSFARADSGVFFKSSKEVLLESQNEKYFQGVALTCLGLGSRLLTLGRYEASKEYLIVGFDAINNEAPANWIGIKSDLIRTVSAVYHHQGKYTEALDYALQSSRLAENSKIPMQLLKSYLNLSGLYGELASPENGLGTLQDRLRYRVEAKKYMKLSYQYSIHNASKLTQGATAFNLGALYTENNQPDSALVFLNEAIRLGRATNFHELLSNAYRTKGSIYKLLPDSSIHYLDLAYGEATLAKNPISRIATSLDKAKVLVSQKKWNEAERLTSKTLIDAKQLGLLNDQRSAYLILYEVKNGQSDFRKALEFYISYTSLKDSIVNEKNYARIEELKTKYETELKDVEIKNLEQTASIQALEIKQKNFWLIGIGIGAVLIASILFLFFRQRSLTQQQKALAIENKFLRFQLDPHFLSNALVSIQRFMLENNAAQASNYLTKFSKLMRQLLEYSREELITIEEEIDLLRNYLDIQKLRLKDKFEYEIHVDSNLAISDSRIPPMFAQPFVENAIEHGIGDRDHGKIRISFSEQDNQLLLEIQDDGAGISETLHGEHKSLSTTIIKERIALLNKSGKKPIQMQIGNVANGTGTRVALTLPIYS